MLKIFVFFTQQPALNKNITHYQQLKTPRRLLDNGELQGNYELQDNIEQPARLRAHSGRFSARCILPSCST